jgi:MFS family permease
MLPLTVGFLVGRPISGAALDRFGSRGISTAGALLCASGFAGLLLPVNFSYIVFALLLALVGISQGMFTSPNSSSIMGSIPAGQRGVGSGMRATFVNSGTAISIGVFFTLMIAGLSSRLPKLLGAGLHAAALSAHAEHTVASLPPVSSLFAAQLGINPLRHMLASSGALKQLSATAVGLSLLAALASLLRGTSARIHTQHEPQEAL